MNILFVHEVDWLGKVVFDIHSLAEALSLMGHRVFAVDYENTWKRGHLLDFGTFRTREFDGVSRAFHGSSVTLRRPGFIKLPGLGRLSAEVTHYIQIRNIIREENIDAIVLYSVPTNGVQVIKLARQAGIPVIFRSIDILNQLVPIPLLRPLTSSLEKWVYSRADLILTLTPKLTDYVIKKGAAKSKVRSLLMPLDTNLFHPSVDSGHLRKKWGFAGDDRIVLFVGTLFDFSGLDRFIPLFPEVIERIPNARLLIVGDGPQRSKLEAIINRLGLGERVVITGFEPYDTMPQYMNLAEVCINTFEITGATRDIFPGKTVQYLACGKPLVATDLPGMRAVVQGEEQGVVYAESPESIADNVISLLESPERLAKLGQAAYDYAATAHDYRVIAGQLESAIKELTERCKDERG